MLHIEIECNWMTPLNKCVSEEESSYILKEIHEGICGVQIRASVLVRKVIWYRYFWQTMQENTK